MENTHSQVGASSCERWWNCPGSVRLVATLPPQPTSGYAKDGQKAHALAEFALRKNVDAFKASTLYNVDDGIGVGISMEMVEAVQVYLDVIDEDIFKYKMKKADLEIEKQFVLTHIHPDARGTNDANLGVFLDRLIVYDFKFGSGVAVEAEENKQAMYYALGAMQGGDYDIIEVVIVQPRAIHRDGPVRRWSLSRAALVDFGRELKLKIESTQALSAKLVCGDHCQKYFCPALAVCPAVKGQVNEVARGVFDEPVRALPTPESLTPVALRKLLETIPLIDAYVKAVEAYALNILNTGGSVPGYKLVQKKSNRQWRDEEAVIKRFGELCIKRTEAVISPAQMEAALKLEHSAKESKQMVDMFTFKPDTGTTMASEDDPREAVRPKLEGVFSDQNQQDIFS